MVAENKAIWIYEGKNLNISWIWPLNPLESISSASSRMNNRRESVLKNPFFIISCTRPGVPTTIWTPVYKIRISSRMFVPPMHAWTETFKYWPMSLTTSAIWVANSRVGETISAWHCFFSWSITWSEEIVNVAVLPVPLWACAMVSCPYNTGRMPFC